jgi:hypothetical protein
MFLRFKGPTRSEAWIDERGGAGGPHRVLSVGTAPSAEEVAEVARSPALGLTIPQSILLRADHVIE